MNELGELDFESEDPAVMSSQDLRNLVNSVLGYPAWRSDTSPREAAALVVRALRSGDYARRALRRLKREVAE